MVKELICWLGERASKMKELEFLQALWIRNCEGSCSKFLPTASEFQEKECLGIHCRRLVFKGIMEF